MCNTAARVGALRLSHLLGNCASLLRCSRSLRRSGQGLFYAMVPKCCGQCTSEAKDSEREIKPLASTSKPLVTTATNFQFRGAAPPHDDGPGPGLRTLPQPEGQALQEPGALPRRSRPKRRRCACSEAESEHHRRSGPLWRRLAPTSGRPSASPCTGMEHPGKGGRHMRQHAVSSTWSHRPLGPTRRLLGSH